MYKPQLQVDNYVERSRFHISRWILYPIGFWWDLCENIMKYNISPADSRSYVMNYFTSIIYVQ